jgi:hypothetical protein
MQKALVNHILQHFTYCLIAVALIGCESKYSQVYFVQQFSLITKKWDNVIFVYGFADNQREAQVIAEYYSKLYAPRTYRIVTSQISDRELDNLQKLSSSQQVIVDQIDKSYSAIAQNADKPPSITRTDEMIERLERSSEKTGDSRVADMVSNNILQFRAVEEAAKELLKAHDQLDPPILSYPEKSTKMLINKQISILEALKKSASNYQKEINLWENLIKKDLETKYSKEPQIVEQGLAKAREGNILVRKWIHAAVSFSDAACKHLNAFQSEGRVNEELLHAMTILGDDYDAATQKVLERSKKNFQKLESTLPR